MDCEENTACILGFFFFFSHAKRHVGSYSWFPDRGWNPFSLQQKWGSLHPWTGRSLECFRRRRRVASLKVAEWRAGGPEVSAGCGETEDARGRRWRGLSITSRRRRRNEGHVWGVGSPGKRAEPGACCQQAAIKGRLGMAGESEEFERSLLGNTVRWEQDGQGASKAAWSLSQEVRVYLDCHLQNFVTFILGREFK